MKKPKKTSGKKMSKLEKLKKRRQALASKGGGGDMFFIGKPGTYRMRPVPVIEDMENALEIIQFYLGPEIKGVISPASIGLPCALEEQYQALKESDDEDDQEIAGNMSRRTRYVMPHYRYKDEKGSEADIEAGVRLLLMTGNQYQDWLDYYLEDEIGDPSDPLKGFDIKYKREGSGKFDTEYTLLNCKPTKCEKKFRGPYDPEEMLKKVLPTYDQTLEYLNKFMGGSDDDDEDEPDEDDLMEKSPKKKKAVSKRKSLSKSGKKKKKVVKKKRRG